MPAEMVFLFPEFVTLCPKGANKLRTMYKADDGTDRFELETLAKADQEKGEILALVAVPNHLDKAEHWATPEKIKRAAYYHAKKGGKLDVRHDEKALPREKAFPAESFIVQAGDPRFVDLKDRDGKPVDATGGWGMVIKVEDEALKASYSSGGWEGVSMGGLFLPVEGRAPLRKEDQDMALSDEDVSKIAKAVTGPLTEALKPLAEALKPLQKSAEPEKKTKTRPEFSGDPDDPKAVRRHLRELKKFDASTEIDWDDPEAVEAHLETLQKADEDGKDAEIKALEGRLQKLRKSSRAPGGGASGGSDPASDADAFMDSYYGAAAKE